MDHKKIKELPVLDAFGFKIARVMAPKGDGTNTPVHTSMVEVQQKIVDLGTIDTAKLMGEWIQL